MTKQIINVSQLGLIISILFLATNVLTAQTVDAWVKEIRTEYALTQKKLSSYDTTMMNIWEESTEGGEAVAYYDGLELRKIQVIWYGEMGKNSIEYYFTNQQLIFAFNQRFNYNRPIYWDKAAAKESGDQEAFDPTKTIVKEDRYYFNKEKLFLWLDDDKKEVDLTKDDTSIKIQVLIDHSAELKSKLKK